MTANQLKRAKSLPVREIAARVFAVEGSQMYFVAIRTGAVLGEFQPNWYSCFGPNGPCEHHLHRDSPCSHILSAVLQIQKEQEAANG